MALNSNANVIRWIEGPSTSGRSRRGESGTGPPTIAKGIRLEWWDPLQLKIDHIMIVLHSPSEDEIPLMVIRLPRLLSASSVTREDGLPLAPATDGSRLMPSCSRIEVVQSSTPRTSLQDRRMEPHRNKRFFNGCRNYWEDNREQGSVCLTNTAVWSVGSVWRPMTGTPYDRDNVIT